MRFIKPATIGFAILFAILCIFSLLMPSRIKMARSVFIDAPADSIRFSVEDLTRWVNWHPFFRENKELLYLSKDSLRFSSGGQAFSLFRQKNKADILQFALTDGAHPPLEYFFYFNEMQMPRGVDVHWQLNTRLRWYPWEKFSGIFFEERNAPSYEEALQSLKDYCLRGR